MSSVKKRFKTASVMLLAFFITISCITPAFAKDAEPVWTTVAPMSTAHEYCPAEVVDGKIYVFGSWRSYGTYDKTVEEYDPLNGKWTTKSPMPMTLCQSESTVVDGKIYIIGGVTGTSINKNMYIYNPKTDSWRTVNLFSARSDHQVVVVNGKIYIIGGRDGSATLSSVEMYDPTTDSVTLRASMNYSRSSFTAQVVDGKIYVFGGVTSSVTTSSVEAYDPATNTWTSKNQMPFGMAGLASSVINKKILVNGSSNNYYTGLYDPQTDLWKSTEPMGTPRTGCRLESINGNVYALAGMKHGGVEISSAEQYNFETNKWISIASLASPRVSFQSVICNNEIYVIGGHSSGNSVEKYPLSSSTPTDPTDPTVPTAPTNLTAIGSESKVNLSWGDTKGAAGYNVHRSTTPGGPYTQIATGVTGTAFADSDVTNGTTYYYVVTAITSNGKSEYSNEASATPKKEVAKSGFAILYIYMIDGTVKEYDLTMDEVRAFIDWYDARDNGTGKAYYILEKPYNKGPFKARKEHIVFDKIKDFEVNEYN